MGLFTRQGNGQIFEKYLAGTNNVAAGQTVYDTILVCGRAADSFYLRFEASSSFKYQWSYVMVDTSVNDIEPNNDFVAALPIAELQTKVGHIKYSSNGGADDLDYYKTLLPKDGTIKIMVQATNMSCGNGQWVYLRGYDRRQGNGQIFEKYLGGTNNVAAGQTVYDTILVCGRTADSFYLRFEATSSFKYQWSYVMVDTSVNDVEPNNSFATAIGVGSNQTKSGHIKYYSNGGADDLDYYKFIFANTDSLKLQMQATNMSCGNGQWLYIRAYDKNFTQLFERYFANTNAVAAGQTVYDSIKILVNAPDTIYLRYEATNPFKYQFTTNPRLPSASFSIVGDSTVCFGIKTYKAANVVDDNVVYNWALSGGGSLSFTDSIATVNWTTNGTHNLSLYLSNNIGNSIIKQKQVIVNNNAPTEVPVLQNFARTLSTNNLPSGTVCKWFKSGVEIIGITDSIYYAQDSGIYTVRFVRPCGTGPASNAVNFPLPAQAQTITFVHTANIIMSPTAKAKLNATASSGLPVSYQLISGNATIVGDSVFVTSVGTVIVKAIQQGSDVYAAAAPKFDTITVVQGPQSITFNAIPVQIYSTTPLPLTATASSGLPVSYTIVSGNANISGSNVIMTGAGNVTVQAVQIGNVNYSAATSVQQTFCIAVRNLTAINGSISPCLNNYIYTTDKIPGANYVWTLSSGGTITTNRDTAFISWTTTGTHTITVKANSACDAVYSNMVTLTITTANNPPTIVTNMLPVNNAINQQLPLTLSWLPGLFTVNYDLYVWDSAQVQPAIPFAANINTVSYTIPQNSFVYNKAYKWRIVSKNPCLFTAGPIQQFRLVPLPDLAVTQVLAPLTAFSGQTISISWTVKNNGPGRTQTNQIWSDAVYLSFDTIPNFTVPPQTNPGGWAALDFPIRPLLIGTRPNVSALDSNQSYTNSISFTLPVNYSQPLYVYVITNNPANGNLPQTTVANDTARAAQPIAVTLSPTPDLRVDTVFAPSSTFSGSAVNVTYKVKNYGVVTPPNVGWYDKFYISPTANFNIANAVQIYPENYFGTNKYYNLCFGSYHALYRTAQLNADSSYTNSLQLVIPNFIYGAYFIHVFTNTEGTVYEGALNNNNTNSKQIQVFLTPTPVLEVATLNVPFTNVSTTQPVGINWNINNAGIFDNFEKNQGHHAKRGDFCGDFLVGYTAPPNSQPIYAAGYYFTDSLGWGSSYWNEKIYLSKDSGNINTANLIYVGKYNHGSEVRQAPCSDYNNTCLPGGNNDRNIQNIIRPTLNYPGSYSFDVPDTLSTGNYYIYVLANADKTVYEYPAINRYKRSGMIAVNRPDLVPPTITIPPTVNAGIPFSINYSVSNAGPGNVFNHIRRDRIYVSTSPVFDGNAQIISTQIFTENVLIGTPVQHNFTYTFPPGTPTSTRYFYVHTNYDSAFKETNLTNNRSGATATNVTIAIAKDLIVSSVQLPANLTDTVFTIANVPFKYTVTNNGTDSIAGKNWIDSIFVSCSPTFNASTAFYLVQRTHNNTLAAGQSYSDSFNFMIPKFSYELNGCFGIDNTNAYFFVRTNADTGVYEGVNMVNNYTASIQKKLINPYIDLIVTSVTAADTATVARNYTTNWVTKNIKYSTTYGPYNYANAVYFSPDSVFNTNAILVNNSGEDRRLLTNQSMNSTNTYILPNIPAGDYYVHVKANAYNSIPAEKNVNNNTNLIRNGVGAAKKIRVNATPLPDITDSIVAAPTFMAVGQTYNVMYKIKNEGVGVSFPNGMNTAVYLSPTAAPGGMVLQYTLNFAPLQVGQFYKDSIFVTIPINTIPGNYVLVVNADNSGNIIESNENNNIAFKYVTVFSPAPSDLIVQNVSHPDTVNLGYTIDSLKWIVRNISSNSAQGVSSDGLYLSSSNTFDSTATLVGIKNKTINMLPLSNDTLFAQPLVNNVTEGNYKVFVKTDLLNNIVETNKDNNTGTPIGKRASFKCFNGQHAFQYFKIL
jgi:CARDB/PKD-like domain